MAGNTKNIYNFKQEKIEIMKEVKQQSKESKQFTDNLIKTFSSDIIKKVNEKEYEADNLVKEFK